MATYNVAYCGGIMTCSGYTEPHKNNISGITNGTSLDESAKNYTDADAFVVTNTDLHVFKSNCKPTMLCEYSNTNGKQISVSSGIWARRINPSSSNPNGETFVMGNYFKFSDKNSVTNCCANGTVVEYMFANDDSQSGAKIVPGDPESEANTINTEMSTTLTPGMFSGCTTLVKCNVPCQKRNIGNSAFTNCTSLTSYTENYDFIDTIGSSAFRGCTAFSTIVIPQFAIISTYSFYGCSNATALKWDKLGQNGKKCRMTYIPAYSFYGCTKLKSTQFSDGSTNAIIIPSGITSIHDDAFKSCTSIENLILKSVTSIGVEAFEYCYNLTSITGFSNVSKLGAWAFNSVGNGNMVSFDSFSGLRDIDYAAFKKVYFSRGISLTDCSINTTYTGQDNDRGAFAYAAINGNLELNSCGIGWRAFQSAKIYGNLTLNNCSCPNSHCHLQFQSAYVSGDVNVTNGNVCDYEFYNTNINGNLTISNCTSIGEYALSSLSANSITITSCTNVGSYILSNTDISNVNIDFESLETIKGHAFESFSNSVFNNLNLNNAEYIGNYAFYNHNDIRNLTIGYSSSTIGNYAFYGCNSITSLTINSVNLYGGEHMFDTCRYLKEIVLSSANGYFKIPSYAFYYCDDLETIQAAYYDDYAVEFPGKVIIEEHAFDECWDLGYAWYSSKGKMIFMDDATINENAFRNCYNLSSVTFSGSSSIVYGNAFNNCTALTSVTFSGDSAIVYGDAFSGCSRLNTVYIDECKKVEINSGNPFPTENEDLKVILLGYDGSGSIPDWVTYYEGNGWESYDIYAAEYTYYDPVLVYSKGRSTTTSLWTGC